MRTFIKVARKNRKIERLTQFVSLNGANIVLEQSAQTGMANILSGGIDEVFTRTDSSGTWSPLFDGLGSSLSLTDATGAIQTEYSYGAFGQSATSGAGNNNSAQYTGRENDGTGLQYNRARYYSPVLQRFISEDPLGFGGGDVNLYGYAANSPTNFTDPSGMAVGDVRTRLRSLAARKLNVDYVLGFTANYAAGLGDRFGQMCLPLPLAIIGVNPVGAIRDLTPGGATIDYNSSAYRSGGDTATILAITLGAGTGGGAGSGVRAAAAESELPGLPASAPKPLGLASTGRTVPANLSEQLAMEEAMSNPGAGTQIPLRQGMVDPRWPGSQGWVKMGQNVNGHEIHYVWNLITGAVDDFKFK